MENLRIIEDPHITAIRVLRKPTYHGKSRQITLLGT